MQRSAGSLDVVGGYGPLTAPLQHVEALVQPVAPPFRVCTEKEKIHRESSSGQLGMI